MKRLLATLFAAVLAWSAVAQTREELYDRFQEASEMADTAAMAAVMIEWEGLYPDDAELYSVRANYYYLSSREEVIILSDKEPADGREYLEVKDSLGVKDYMYTEIQIDSSKHVAATMALAEGISRYPDRLDLRLGKVTLHLYSNENDLAVEEVIAALEHSVKNQNKWCETLDVPVESDGVAYLRDCIQDYFVHFINTDDLASAEKMIDACISIYPDEVMFLSDKGSIRYYADDQQGALEWFLMGNRIAPDDMIIVANIALIFQMQGDKDNALKYYNIMAESDDPEFSDLAKYEIQKLTAPVKQREIIPVDWKEIKKIAKKNPETIEEAVRKLSEVTLDPSITYHDRIIAFYGQALLTKGKEQSLADEASKLFSKKDYVNALDKAKKALEINPLNLTALDKAGSAIAMLMEVGDTSFTSDDAMYYFNVAMRIYNTIATTGYGNEEHPFCVTSVADEYEFMRNYLDIYRIQQQALVGMCDVFTLAETSQYYSEPKLYFDATLPLERLEGLF